MKGLLITFEGNEGSGKTTQIALLVEQLQKMGRSVRFIREPGGTPIGEEIRHTLKHSHANEAMSAEAELLLMNASRAQLVRETIRPALAQGEIIVCDRFYDSTTAYQGYGRQLDLKTVKAIIDFAVGDTRPELTILLQVTGATSQERLRSRQSSLPFVRDRIEEADRAFFDRVIQGYEDIARAEPHRVRCVDANGAVGQVQAVIWRIVAPLVDPSAAAGQMHA